MPARFCLSCGGRYHTTDANGMAYYHTCPDHTIVSVTRGALKLDVELHAVQPGDVIVSQRNAPRANARDENVQADGKTKGQPIAAGAGVLEAPDAATLAAAVAASPAAALAVTQGAPAPAPTPVGPIGVAFS